MASQAPSQAQGIRQEVLLRCWRAFALKGIRQLWQGAAGQDPPILVQEPVRLSDARERTAPFSSAMGATMVATRTALSATKQVRHVGPSLAQPVVERCLHGSKVMHLAHAGRCKTPLLACLVAPRQRPQMTQTTLCRTSDLSLPSEAGSKTWICITAPVFLLWLQAVGRRGIGILVTPDAATLPPWGTLRVDLACCTDMCGQYADVLHCQVGCANHCASAD